MEDKIKNLTKLVEDLKKEIDLLKEEQKKQTITIDKIAKDIGAQDAQNLGETIYKIDRYFDRDMQDIKSMVHDVKDVRRNVVEMEVLLKEIMRGMSVIYSSVDEIEENILPERQTK